MPVARILFVDDDETVRLSMCKVLVKQGFEVVSAASVSEALGYIASQNFDVLLSDLHMPGAGDGLTVVSAMRHANPDAVTLLLSAFPEMSAASNAILMQTDEILVKPMQVTSLIETIKQRLAKGPLHKRKIEPLATILERTTADSIEDWYTGVENDNALMSVSMSREQRCMHLPALFRDLGLRLRGVEPLGSRALKSGTASLHGLDRQQRGYTAAMMVDESRLLQVTIFHTLQKNLGTIDFSVLLLGVMTIADEVDSQLSQAMKSYIKESFAGALPA